MNSRRYWKNRLPFLLTNLVCMAALTVFLLVCGNSVSAVVLILIVWALILLTGLVLTYWKRKRQMKKLLDMAEQLSERYLISEVMELPEQAEDQVYYQLLKMAGKSMLEQIGEVERERLEYKEYIEQWIHEIKTPITAMKLLCENHRTDWTKELLLELEKTNRFTEQALYYARSEHTEKDYSVREMALSQVVHQAIADNKYLLLQSGMRLEVEEMQDTVYSDEKWVRFILNQLIANAVKYRTEQPVLRISTHKRQDQVVLGRNHDRAVLHEQHVRRRCLGAARPGIGGRRRPGGRGTVAGRRPGRGTARGGAGDESVDARHGPSRCPGQRAAREGGRHRDRPAGGVHRITGIRRPIGCCQAAVVKRRAAPVQAPR